MVFIWECYRYQKLLIILNLHNYYSIFYNNLMWIYRMNKYHVDSSKSYKDESIVGDDKSKPIGPNKKLTTMWRYIIGDQAFSTKTGNSKMNKITSESVIGI